jgi:TRAP-type C4-dicarboxylate transport system permease small subunit
MLNVLERLADILGWLASTIARVMLIFIAAVLFLQVVLRYVFSYSLPWPEEAARYLMIWVVMLAGSLLIKDEQLVTVDFFDKIWPRRLLIYRNVLFRILLAGLLGTLFWQGIDLATFSANRTTVALQISWFWPYLAIPVGSGLMLFHMLVLALRDILRGPPEHHEPTVLRAEI